MIDRTHDHAADFASSLLEFSAYVEGSFEKVLRKACIDLYRRIVERTPVDTGRAKAGWSFSTDDGSQDRDVAEKSYAGAELASIINQNVAGFRVDVRDSSVTIYNNVEYVSHLEYGTSKIAPAGMVSLSLVEFTSFFREELKGLKGLEIV